MVEENDWIIYVEPKIKYIAKALARKNKNIKSLKEAQRIMNSIDFRKGYELPKGMYDSILKPNASKVYDELLKEYATQTNTKEIQTTFKDYVESSKELSKLKEVSSYGNLKTNYLRTEKLNWSSDMKSWIFENSNIKDNKTLTENFNKKFNVTATKDQVRTQKYRLRGTKDKGKYKFKK